MPLRAGTAATLDYCRSPLPIRDELLAAHRRAWTRLAAPGEWWTGRGAGGDREGGECGD